MKIYHFLITAFMIMSGLLSEATHNCANGLVTTVTGSKYVRVRFAEKYTCVGTPTGGTYTWTCSGELNITTDPNDPSIVYVTASAVSSALKDQFVKCVYTVSGKSCDEKIEVTNVEFRKDKRVYWCGYDSDGTTRLSIPGYSTSSGIHVDGIPSGTLKWEVVEGTDKLELATDSENPTFSSSVVEVNNSSIHVRSTAGSNEPKDIKIKVTHDNVEVAKISMSVGQAKYFTPILVTHLPNSIPPFRIGYMTTVIYELTDQFGNVMDNYPVGEYFPFGTTSLLLNDWGLTRASTGGYYTDANGRVRDGIGVSLVTYMGHDPSVEEPNSPLGTTLVARSEQYFRAGKAESDNIVAASGVPLSCHIIWYYLDHASVSTEDGVEHQ